MWLEIRKLSRFEDDMAVIFGDGSSSPESQHMRAFTSLPSDITARVESYDWFDKCKAFLPEGGKVFGELHVPGMQASQVKSALAEQWPKLEFTPFATTVHEDHVSLECLDAFFASHGLDIAPYLVLPNGCDGSEVADYCKMLPGTEGWVFKNGNLADWAKWKPIQTIDAVITGYKDGNGKYLGLTGALVASVYSPDNRLVPIANVSGMDDKTRIYISADEDAYLGRVIEVAYQYVGSQGRLRHPRFVRFRDDKAPETCLLSQDPDLEKCHGVVN